MPIPFFADSPLPLHYPQFDKIKDSDFAPAFDARHGRAAEGDRRDRRQPRGADLRQHHRRDGEVRPAARPRAPPCSSTWSAPTPTTRARSCRPTTRRSSPRTATRSRSTPSCSRASRRCTTSAPRSASTPQGVRLVERYHTDFVRAGANLSEADKAKLQGDQRRAGRRWAPSSARTCWPKSTPRRSWSTRKDELDGLTDEQIAAAAEAAKARKLDGKYVIALLNTTGQPPEAQLTNRAAARAAAQGLGRARQPRRRVRQPRASCRRSPSCAPSAPSCSATRTTPPTCSRTRPPRRPTPSTRCSASWRRPPSPTRSAKRPTCRR